MAALAVATALADPVSLRGPAVEPTAVVGLHEISLAAPLADGPLALAASMRADRGAVDVALGRRFRLRGDDFGWRTELGLAGGLVVPLVRPGLGVTLTPWASTGLVRPRGFLQGVVAAPLVVAAPGGLRLPVLFELQGGGRVGPVTVGPRIGIGVVGVPGTDVSVATELALLLSFRLREDDR